MGRSFIYFIIGMIIAFFFFDSLSYSAKEEKTESGPAFTVSDAGIKDHRITIHRTKTIEDLSKEYGFKRSADVNSLFFPKKGAEQGTEEEIELYLLDFHHYVNFDSALVVMEKFGYRPATVEEAVYYPAIYKYTVFCLGSKNGEDTPYIESFFDGNFLEKHICVGKWNFNKLGYHDLIRFAAVKK